MDYAKFVCSRKTWINTFHKINRLSLYFAFAFSATFLCLILCILVGASRFMHKIVEIFSNYCSEKSIKWKYEHNKKHITHLMTFLEESCVPTDSGYRWIHIDIYIVYSLLVALPIFGYSTKPWFLVCEFKIIKMYMCITQKINANNQTKKQKHGKITTKKLTKWRSFGLSSRNMNTTHTPRRCISAA